MVSAVLVDDADGRHPWMVMVHGMSQDHRVFGRQVEAFRSQYRILLIDLPGHGLSSDVAGPFGHVEFAEHVAQALSENGVEDACYWGTHTGATVGLWLAATARARFKKLILEGPVVPGENPRVVVDAIDLARRTAEKEGIAAAIKGWWRESCWFEHMRSNSLECRAAEHLSILMEFGGRPWTDGSPARPVEDIKPRLANLLLPTLIYNGAADHPEFLDVARFLESELPDAQRRVVDNSGGFPGWENPDAVNAIVAEFIRED